jgi:hypothetical protein
MLISIVLCSIGTKLRSFVRLCKKISSGGEIDKLKETIAQQTLKSKAKKEPPKKGRIENDKEDQLNESLLRRNSIATVFPI